MSLSRLPEEKAAPTGVCVRAVIHILMPECKMFEGTADLKVRQQPSTLLLKADLCFNSFGITKKQSRWIKSNIDERECVYF